MARFKKERKPAQVILLFLAGLMTKQKFCFSFTVSEFFN